MPYKNPQAIRGNILPLMLNNFSGGWNPRDAPSEIGDNESPDCINVTLDERGGVVKRNGLIYLGSGTGLVNSPKNFFAWTSGNLFVVQDGVDLKTTSNFVSYTTIKTFSTSDRCAMCDFNNHLVIVHPIDGVFSWDGTAFGTLKSGTIPAPGSGSYIAPKGNCIAVWQNKVWIAGDPAHPARVVASLAGDELGYADVDNVEVREKDGLVVTALGAGQGMDISGRPGLLVFKLDSVHRINDSRSGNTFGAYTTLHNKAGAVSPLAVVSTTVGTVVFLGTRGIYMTDGVNPPVLVSGKISPVFDIPELNLHQTLNWCGGVYKDRVLFSMSRGSAQTTNNFTLEVHPSQGWIVPHSFGVKCFCETIGSAQSPDKDLFAAHPTDPKIVNVFHGGSDYGAKITSNWQSRWFEPAGGYEIRMRRLIVAGRGNFTVYTKTDYSLGQGIPSNFVGSSTGGVWGTAIWGRDLWSGPLYESYVSFYSLGVCRSVSFNLIEVSDKAAFAPPSLGNGVPMEVGGFALYGLKLDFIRLGYT